MIWIYLIRNRNFCVIDANISFPFRLGDWFIIRFTSIWLWYRRFLWREEIFIFRCTQVRPWYRRFLWREDIFCFRFTHVGPWYRRLLWCRFLNIIFTASSAFLCKIYLLFFVVAVAYIYRVFFKRDSFLNLEIVFGSLMLSLIIYYRFTYLFHYDLSVG